MNAPTVGPTLGPALLVIDVLEDLSVSYQVGGSFASSMHGIPRQTQDIDLVVDLPTDAISLFVERLSEAFYVDETSVRSAVRRRASFHLIHLKTAFKVDCFQKGDASFDEIELERSVSVALDQGGRSIWAKSPEDTVLRKLLWYREGGHVSSTQWQDVLGLIRAQGERLDRAYLESWARDLRLEELLARALEEPG